MMSFDESLTATFSETDTWKKLAGLRGRAVTQDGRRARVDLDESYSIDHGPTYTVKLIFDDLARTMEPTHDFDEVLATLSFSP